MRPEAAPTPPSRAGSSSAGFHANASCLETSYLYGVRLLAATKRPAQQVPSIAAARSVVVNALYTWPGSNSA
jgi:hypothetical protein